jgi:hypothetical protein
MTKMECWLLGLTDSQMWNYATSQPIFNCPLFGSCCLGHKKCGSDECWHKFKEWAKTPVKEDKSK